MYLANTFAPSVCISDPLMHQLSLLITWVFFGYGLVKQRMKFKLELTAYVRCFCGYGAVKSALWRRFAPLGPKETWSVLAHEFRNFPSPECKAVSQDRLQTENLRQWNKETMMRWPTNIHLPSLHPPGKALVIPEVDSSGMMCEETFNASGEKPQTELVFCGLKCVTKQSCYTSP